MSENPTEQKWNQHYREAGPLPAIRVVSENLHLVPNRGDGLDLACGLAANAFMLAEHGLSMRAWDISPVAVAKVNEIASQRHLPVVGEVCDLAQHTLPVDVFDIIVVTHYLDRNLVTPLMAALRPQGLLLYQTFTRTRIDSSGPSNEDFRLADNELLELFSPLRILVYREEGKVGDVTRGLRNEAMLIGQKVETSA